MAGRLRGRVGRRQRAYLGIWHRSRLPSRPERPARRSGRRRRVEFRRAEPRDVWNGRCVPWRAVRRLAQPGFYASGVLSYDHSETRIATIPDIILPASFSRPRTSSAALCDPWLRRAADRQIPGAVGERIWGDWLRGEVRNVHGDPVRGLEFASLHTDAFTENNQSLPSVIGPSVASGTTTSVPSYLGLRSRRRVICPTRWRWMSGRAARGSTSSIRPARPRAPSFQRLNWGCPAVC